MLYEQPKLRTLDVLGVIDQYSNSFDVQAYKQNRTWYYTRLYCHQNEPLMKEIINYAKAHNVQIPFRAKVEGTALCVIKKILGSCIMAIRSSANAKTK